ncbi:BnaC04g11400D [Brassica napus]|uniref:BnaC04g11400D protein n=1 Tax=Brassica napus TaxID=3708 RepID=A0A078G1V7_BRANA|nr:BnaC04g11400D [Brassica napus]
MSISITNVSLIKGNITQECRGDSYGSKCRTCIDIAVAGVMSRHTFKYRIKFLQCCKTLSLI